MPRVTFYFDVVSPWANFAFQILKRYERKWDLTLVLKPTYLGGVMVASGNKPPITVVNKGKYMNEQDMPLCADYFKVPYGFPDAFPFNTIHAIRFLRIVEEKAPEKLRAATEIFFEQTWGPSKTKIGASAAVKPENFVTFLTPLFSEQEIAKFGEEAQSEANKERIKQESAKLVGEGAFGFPWIVAENDKGQTQPFFGSDRFELMAYFLGKKWEGPLPGEQAKL